MEPQPPRWLDDQEQRLWRHLLGAHRKLRERLEDDLQVAAGIGLGDYDVLVHLSEAPGGALRMSELAERLLLSKSGMTRRVDGMARDGLVTRRRCERDGRGWYASLTPAGWDLLRRAAPAHVAGVRRYLLDVLDDPASLASALSRIEVALDEPPPPAHDGQPIGSEGQSGIIASQYHT